MARLETPRLASGQRMIVEREIGNQVWGVTIYATSGVARAVAAFGDQADVITRTLYEALGGRNRLPDAIMLQANKAIAKQAQNAIVEGWRARLPAKSSPYRRGSDPNKDRLSGKLGETLASAQMTRGTTARGISFLNVGVLNEEARHWYRVNYGAWGPRAILRRPKSYPVTVAGHTLFVLRDEAQPASNSWLPKRFIWTEAGYFEPRMGPATVHGGGHRAAVFTDLGFQSLAENVGPVYDRTFRHWIKQRGSIERLRSRGATVHVTSEGRITKS